MPTRLRDDTTAHDAVTADRVRSALGPLLRRLDLPRVSVMVDHGVVALHGEVGTSGDVAAIAMVVADVPGVEGVESHLHVGLGAGATRPSHGRRPQPSPALQRLRDAVIVSCGLAVDSDRIARSVLHHFLGLIPPDERRHVVEHLPADVGRLLHGQLPGPREPRRIRSVAALAEAIADDGVLHPEEAVRVAAAVLAVLRDLVPEEVADVTAVLPADLKLFWLGAAPG